MQFTDSANGDGLVEDVDFLCGTDSDSFPLKDKARLMNHYIYQAIIAKIKADKSWIFVDSNTGKTAESTKDLVDSQQDYSIPSNALKIVGISVKDSSGNWVQLRHRPVNRMPSDPAEYLETDGLPQEYSLFGQSVLLYPAPASSSVTTSGGLKMIISKEIDKLTAADTTQEPPLPEPFHRIASLGCAQDFLRTTGDMEKADNVQGMYLALLDEYIDFESDRIEDEKPRIIPRHNVRNYI